MYSLFFKKVRPSNKLKKEAERVANEILDILPEQADVQITMQRTQDPSRSFQVSMLVRGLSRPIVITRVGQGAFNLLRQVEKLTLQEVKRLKDKKIAATRVPTVWSGGQLPPQAYARPDVS